jgi:CRP-like cAMP-binding protein
VSTRPTTRDAGGTTNAGHGAHAPADGLVLPTGAWDPRVLDELDPRPFGVLVVDGLILRELVLADGGAAEMLGPGDIVALRRPAEESLPLRVRWDVAAPTHIVPLAADLLGRLEERPDLTARLMTRALHQVERQAAHRAVVQLPRVEQRVLGLLWLLAQRWGHVGTAGVIVPIELTHAALGRLVGARRPTVSLALKALGEDGMVVRRDDGSWLLRHDSAMAVFGEGTTPEPIPAPTVLPKEVPFAPSAEADRVRTVALDVEALRERILRLHDRRVVTQRRSRELLARCRQTRQDTAARRQAPDRF